MKYAYSKITRRSKLELQIETFNYLSSIIIHSL